MGTMVQRRKLTEADFRGERFASHPRDLKGNNDLLVLTRPDVLAAIHAEYLEAGADIIETNTFSRQAVSQADYGLEAHRLRAQRRGAPGWRGASPTSGRRRRPTGRGSSPARSARPPRRCRSRPTSTTQFSRITFDEIREAYADQAHGLLEGGVDLLMVETIFDTLNAKAAIIAIAELFEETGKPCPLSFPARVTDRTGRTLSGQTVEAFLRRSPTRSRSWWA